jgi:hypothetical protein
MAEIGRAPLCKIRLDNIPPFHQFTSFQLLSSSVAVADSNANERFLPRFPPVPRFWYAADRDGPADTPGDFTGQSSISFNQLAENAMPRILFSNCTKM